MQHLAKFAMGFAAGARSGDFTVRRIGACWLVGH